MIRFKRALSSLCSQITCLALARKTRRICKHSSSYMQNKHSMRTTTPLSTYTSPLTQHAALPTAAVNRYAALVCKFSYGSGLLVYVNGVLMSAARIALQVNMATLDFVNKLPFNEMDAVGRTLAVAFAHSLETVEIAYAEVGAREEQKWRDAEREWEIFNGGPYLQSSFISHSVRRMEDSRCRFNDNGAVEADEWLTVSAHDYSLLQDGNTKLELQSLYSCASSSSSLYFSTASSSRNRALPQYAAPRCTCDGRRRVRCTSELR